MKTTIEISNYPLHEDFEVQILDFINRCKESALTIKVNATSTHIQGDYDLVMDLLKREVKTSFEKFGKMIFVIKILKGELDLNFNL